MRIRDVLTDLIAIIAIFATLWLALLFAHGAGAL
jgi:hypothetical protein